MRIRPLLLAIGLSLVGLPLQAEMTSEEDCQPRAGGTARVQLDVLLARVDGRALQQNHADLLRNHQQHGENHACMPASHEEGQRWRALLLKLRAAGLAKVLIEPPLHTQSGSPVSYFSAGAAKVPRVAGFGGEGAYDCEWDFLPLHMQIALLPIVRPDGSIRLSVEPSDGGIQPDPDGFNGAFVPGQRVWGGAIVEPGQTLVVRKAGAIRQIRDIVLPLFGPVGKQEVADDLVLLVTARLIVAEEAGQDSGIVVTSEPAADQAAQAPAAANVQVELDLIMAQVNRQAMGKIGRACSGIVMGQLEPNGRHMLLTMLQALREANALEFWSNPKLTAQSGQAASLHSGDAQEVPVQAEDGTMTTQRVPLGTQVEFLPIVQANGQIYVEIECELSDVDADGGRSSQRVRSCLTLDDGQTVCLGGFIQHMETAGEDQQSSSSEEFVVFATVRVVQGNARKVVPGWLPPRPAREIEVIPQRPTSIAELVEHLIDPEPAEETTPPPPAPESAIDRLQQAIAEAVTHCVVTLIPGVEDTVILCGTVRDAEDVETILRLAKSRFKGHVINALRVGGVTQVQLDVQAFLVDRQALRRDHPDWFQCYADRLAAAQASQDWDCREWLTLLQNLRELGVVKPLAEPHLVTLSGRSATFISGGEQPPPRDDSSCTEEIELVSYGTQVDFLPVVRGDGKILLQVELWCRQPPTDGRPPGKAYACEQSFLLEPGQMVMAAQALSEDEDDLIVLVTPDLVPTSRPRRLRRHGCCLMPRYGLTDFTTSQSIRMIRLK